MEDILENKMASGDKIVYNRDMDKDLEKATYFGQKEKRVFGSLGLPTEISYRKRYAGFCARCAKYFPQMPKNGRCPVCGGPLLVRPK
jgi:DNA-directed RNA polymerase subunit RPC12/RpoP